MSLAKESTTIKDCLSNFKRDFLVKSAKVCANLGKRLSRFALAKTVKETIKDG